MVQDFPGNSNASKVNRPKVASPRVEVEVEGPAQPKIVTGKVIRRKTPLGRRFAETFFKGDGVVAYLLKDVLIPAAQNLLTDFVTQGIEKAVYGEVQSRPRTGYSGYRGSSTINRPYTQYNQPTTIISRPGVNRAVPERRPITQPDALDIGDVILETKVEAQSIAEKLMEIVEEYQVVTVATLNEMLGQTPEYTDNKFGWTNLSSMDIKRVREGWLILLPSPIEL